MIPINPKRPSKLGPSRFVFVISFPRSGTTALGSLLQQPEAEVNYHGEFFALNDWNSKLGKITSFYPFFSLKYLLGYALQRKKWRSYLFESLKLDPERALSSLAQVPGTHVIKIFPTHLYDKSLEAIIAKFEPDVLFIRRNHLDRLVSLKKAMSTQVWHGVSTESVTVDVDEEELSRYILGYEDFYQRMLRCAKENSAKILDVEYEKLFEPEKIKLVLDFILADSNRLSNLNTRPRTIKQDSTGASQQAFLQKTSRNRVRRSISDYDFGALTD